MLKILVIAAMAVSMSGCAVGMAASGSKGQDISGVRTGGNPWRN